MTDLADVLIPLIESPQKEETTVVPSSPPKDSPTATSPPSPSVQYDIDPTDLALASIPGKKKFSMFKWFAKVVFLLKSVSSYCTVTFEQ